MSITLKPVKDVLNERPDLNRTRLYRELNSGLLIAKKIGRRTFIDVASLARRDAQLPDYQPGVSPGVRRKKADQSS